MKKREESSVELSAESVRSRLPETLAGWNIRYYDTIDSTNDEAKRLAAAGEHAPALLLAGSQERGKGRRGRVWTMQPDTAVIMSLLLRPEIRPERASMLTLVMGLAAAKACRSCCGVDVKIKWPNDLVADGRKLCGILTEMGCTGGAVDYLVIGVGINANSTEFPPELRESATSLELLTGKKTDRAALAAAVLEQFEQEYQKYMQTQDFSLLKEEYNACLAGKDAQVRVLEPGNEYCGISRGVNASGELLVEKEDGSTEQVYAGEVSVRGIYGYV